jgi:hypothetical protein
MTPVEVFTKHIPSWRSDVTTAVGGVLLDLIRGPMPPPWDDAVVETIAASTATAAVMSFGKIRSQLGDEIFGALVLFAEHEAKRLALVAAGRPTSNRTAVQ